MIIMYDVSTIFLIFLLLIHTIYFVCFLLSIIEVDCGVFACMAADCLSTNKLLLYQQNNMDHLCGKTVLSIMEKIQ